MTRRVLEEDLLREALVHEGCPEPAEWHRLAAGEADGATAARLTEHARSCAACAVEARLAALFEEPLAEDDAGVRTLVGELRSRRSPLVRRIGEGRSERAAREGEAAEPTWRRTALAAALALALVGGGLFLVRRPGPPPVGAPGDGSVLRGGAVELVAPLGEIDAPPSVLSWEEEPDAIGYRVSLTRVDGRPMWSAEVATGEARLPQDVLATLRPAVTYRWQVVSLSAAGSELGRSQEGEFLIRPGP